MFTTTESIGAVGAHLTSPDHLYHDMRALPFLGDMRDTSNLQTCFRQLQQLKYTDIKTAGVFAPPKAFPQSRGSTALIRCCSCHSEKHKCGACALSTIAVMLHTSPPLSYDFSRRAPRFCSNRTRTHESWQWYFIISTTAPEVATESVSKPLREKNWLVPRPQQQDRAHSFEHMRRFRRRCTSAQNTPCMKTTKETICTTFPCPSHAYERTSSCFLLQTKPGIIIALPAVREVGNQLILKVNVAYLRVLEAVQSGPVLVFLQLTQPV